MTIIVQNRGRFRYANATHTYLYLGRVELASSIELTTSRIEALLAQRSCSSLLVSHSVLPPSCVAEDSWSGVAWAKRGTDQLVLSFLLMIFYGWVAHRGPQSQCRSIYRLYNLQLAQFGGAEASAFYTIPFTFDPGNATGT